MQNNIDRDRKLVREVVGAALPDNVVDLILDDLAEVWPSCPACGGIYSIDLGQLGSLCWRRCRSCGMDFAEPATEGGES